MLWKDTIQQQVKQLLLPAGSPCVTGITNSIYSLEFLPTAKTASPCRI